MEIISRIKRNSLENTILSLFVVLFYISSIKTFRLMIISAVVIVLYSVISRKNINFIKLTLPVLPIVFLMILPIIIQFIVNRELDDLDFYMMITFKIILSSILLGTVVSRHSILYLIEGILNIGLPQTFNRIFALTFRYFHMINRDIQGGRRALISRGVKERRWLSHLPIIGEWIGGFFLKSSIHGEMVFNAMKSRGFQGDAKGENFNRKIIVLKFSILALFFLGILIIDGKV